MKFIQREECLLHTIQKASNKNDSCTDTYYQFIKQILLSAIALHSQNGPIILMRFLECTEICIDTMIDSKAYFISCQIGNH